MISPSYSKHNLTVIRWLTYMMFLMFAMTTDSVGNIITEVINRFDLSMLLAGAFHRHRLYLTAFLILYAGFLLSRSRGEFRSLMTPRRASALAGMLVTFVILLVGADHSTVGALWRYFS